MFLGTVYYKKTFILIVVSYHCNTSLYHFIILRYLFKSTQHKRELVRLLF